MIDVLEVFYVWIKLEQLAADQLAVDQLEMGSLESSYLQAISHMWGFV
jgi:hypothetical protein